MQYGYGLMRFKLPHWMTMFRHTPELIGHSGSSGLFAFYAPEKDLYIVGTFNQIDKPARPFNFMLNVISTMIKFSISFADNLVQYYYHIDSKIGLEIA